MSLQVYRCGILTFGSVSSFPWYLHRYFSWYNFSWIKILFYHHPTHLLWWKKLRFEDEETFFTSGTFSQLVLSRLRNLVGHKPIKFSYRLSAWWEQFLIGKFLQLSYIGAIKCRLWKERLDDEIVRVWKEKLLLILVFSFKLI